MKGLFEASESSSPLLSNFLTFYFFVVLGISCTVLQTTLISKRILLSNILQKTRKTSIWVNITIPSPPHKFMKVFYQEVRVCITLHFFELFFCCRPITFCVLRVYPSDRIDEIQGVIDCSMIQTQLFSVSGHMLPTGRCAKLNPVVLGVA